MRILTVVRNLGPGGTQRSAQSHAVGYRDAGHESAVLAYEGGGPREAELAAEGIEVFVGDPDDPASAIERAVAWRADSVHIHRMGREDPVSADIMRRLRAESARAVIETNHFARADRSADCRLIDVHIQLSRWCLWQWRRRCRGMRPRPIGIALPHIIRADRFSPGTADERAQWRAEHNIPADAVLFGRVAQPLQPKWSPVLFQAFEKVAAEDANAWLLVVGLPPADRSLIDAMPEPIRRRVVQIEFLHGDEALKACYNALDVFAHACRIGETFGMVICEAALCGVPTITLSTPLRDNSQIEVVGHGRGGLVAGDTASFADAMHTLAADPALREKLSQGAGRWVRESCTSERITSACIDLLQAAHESGSHEELARRVSQLDSVESKASTADLQSVLKSAPGAASLKARVLMELSTIQALGDSKRWLVATLGRGKSPG